MTQTPVNPALPLRLETFGVPAVRAGSEGEGATVLLSAGKPLLLLARLVAIHPAAATRDALALLAWGERDDTHARASLRQALYRLRQLLGRDALVADDHAVALAQPLESDWADATAAVTANDDVRLLSIVRGPYLDGITDGNDDEPDTWLHRERARWRLCTAGAALREGRKALATGNIEGAHALAELAVADRIGALEGWELLLDALRETENPARLSEGLARLEVARAGGLLGAVENGKWRDLLRRATRHHAPATTRALATGHAQALPFVGRDGILARLAELQTPSAGEPQRGIAIVAGPGFGKSRLLRELAIRLAASKQRVVQVEALAAEAGTPWSLLGRVVEALAEFPEAIGMDHGQAAVLVALNPRLGERFAAATGGRHPTDAATLGRALGELLAAVAEHHAVHLLLDDAQWGDEPSLQVLHRVLGSSAGGKVIAVLATRDDARMPPVPWHVVQLPSLGVDDIRDAVAHTFRERPAGEHAATADALLLATGGVPIYLVRALHRLRAEGSEGDVIRRIGTMSLHRAPNFPTDPGERALLGYLAVAGVAVTEDELTTGLRGATDGPLAPVLTRLAHDGWVTLSTAGVALTHGLIQRQVMETVTPLEARRGALRRAAWLATHGEALHDLQSAVRLCALHDALPHAVEAVQRWRRRLPAGTRGRRLVELLLPENAPRYWRWRLIAAATPSLLRWASGVAVIVSLAVWGVIHWLRSPAELRLENIPRVQYIDPVGKVDRNAVAPVLTVRDRLGRISRALDGLPLEVADFTPNVDSVLRIDPMIVRNGTVVADQLRPYFSPQDSVQLMFRVGALPPLAVTVFRGFDIQALRVAGGVLNGQQLAGDAPEVTVAAGDSLLGSVTLRYTTPTQAALWMLGESSTMAVATPDTNTVITLHAGATDALTDVLVKRRVPTAPGNYWLVYAFAAEGEAGQIFSMTNRTCPQQYWDDGNDLLDGADTSLTRIGGGGFLQRQRDICEAGTVSRSLTGYYVAAIRVVVRQADDRSSTIDDRSSLGQAQCCCLRRRAAAMPARPVATSVMVAGSGTTS